MDVSNDFAKNVMLSRRVNSFLLLYAFLRHETTSINHKNDVPAATVYTEALVQTGVHSVQETAHVDAFVRCAALVIRKHATVFAIAVARIASARRIARITKDLIEFGQVHARIVDQLARVGWVRHGIFSMFRAFAHAHRHGGPVAADQTLGRAVFMVVTAHANVAAALRAFAQNDGF
jgi:hypothetical protein